MISKFLGVTTPPQVLVGQIEALGWEVQKLDFSNTKSQYVASGKNPHGDSKEGTGPDPSTALAQLLNTISRHEMMRSASLDLGKFGLYTGQIKEIAQAYTRAPLYDPKVAPYFMELAHDSTHRAKAIREQISVKIVNTPDPYEGAEQMFQDIRSGKLKVSKANAGHPLWSTTQVVNFRIVHDVIGHASSGGGFDWAGENLASRAHAKVLSSTAQIALFAQTIAQSAYRTHHKNLGEPKIAQFKDFFDPIGEGKTQKALHPSQMHVPGLAPGEVRKDPSNKFSAMLRDPNYGYDSGQAPLSRDIGGPGAGYLDYGDPLDSHAVLDQARALDTGFEDADRSRSKQAVVNALRASMLSGRKSLSDNVLHYQDLAHLPFDTEDPKVFHDTLDSRARAWNQAKGIRDRTPWAHLVRPLQGALLQLHPEIEHEKIVGHTQRLLHDWRHEEQQRVEADDHHRSPDKQKSTREIERKAHEGLRKRIEGFLKEKYDPKTDITDLPTRTAGARFKQVSADEFYPSYTAAVDTPGMGDHLDHYDLQALRADPTLSFWHGHGGRVGAVEANRGEERTIGSLYNNEGPRGSGMDLLDHLVKRGPAKLVAIGDKMRSRYESKGWRTEGAEDFADHKAPQGWDLEQFGRPPIYTMSSPKPVTASGASSGDSYEDQLRLESSAVEEDPNRYPSFLSTSLKPLAQVGHHSDDLHKAALEDIRVHNGSGHHFRQQVLNLGIPGLGPKGASFAWYLLHPQKSGLGTIDQSTLEALGGKHDRDMNPRDYYKLERQLAAARDSSGYSHIPLGAFGVGVRGQRSGIQDLSGLRVLDPTPHQHLDHEPKGLGWEQDPEWWKNTQPARDKVGQDFDSQIGNSWSRDSVPVRVGKTSHEEGELCAAVGIPHNYYWLIPELAHSLKSEITFSELTDELDYHITLAYAPQGYFDRSFHEVVNKLPGHARGIPFENPRLDTFPKGDDGYPVVLRFDSAPGGEIAEEVMGAWEDLGAEVSRFSGGYKPHITIGYSDQDLPKDLKGREYPEFAFRGRECYVMIPRALKEIAKSSSAPEIKKIADAVAEGAIGSRDAWARFP